jgi:ribosomal-protein-alanine N-acetyltransferase
LQPKVSTAFPVYQSDRLLLRQIRQSDRLAIFQGLSHPDVIAYYGVSYKNEAAAQEQIEWYAQLEREQSGLWWAICLRDEPEKLIGTCGAYEVDEENRNADLGYWLLPQFWGKGLISEALPLVLAHAFTHLQLHRLEAEVEPANSASIKVLEKCGFQLEGRRREVARKGGQFVDMAYYALLGYEFRSGIET